MAKDKKKKDKDRKNRDKLARAQREANRVGLTTLFAATADEPGLRTYAAADSAGASTYRLGRTRSGRS